MTESNKPRPLANDGFDDPDAKYIEAALSWYDRSAAREDIRAAWGRLRLRLLGIQQFGILPSIAAHIVQLERLSGATIRRSTVAQWLAELKTLLSSAERPVGEGSIDGISIQSNYIDGECDHEFYAYPGGKTRCKRCGAFLVPFPEPKPKGD